MELIIQSHMQDGEAATMVSYWFQNADCVLGLYLTMARPEDVDWLSHFIIFFAFNLPCASAMCSGLKKNKVTLNSGGSIYFPHSNNKNGDFDLQVSQCCHNIFLEEVTDGPDCDKQTNLLFQHTPEFTPVVLLRVGRSECAWDLVVSGYKNPFSRYD